jgi:CRP-like cAMP-binding protein
MDETATPSTARTLLQQLAAEPLPDWEHAAAHLRVVEIAPAGYVFRVGQPIAAIQFVRHGLVKHVYVTTEGDEWIKNFSYENTFFASITALQPGGRATFSSMAMEPTVIERIDYAVVLELAERHMAWQRALRRGLELYGAGKERREHELLTLSATERYERFVSEKPHLAARIPQHDLARYLGITPVALSRIRGRLKTLAQPTPNGSTRDARNDVNELLASGGTVIPETSRATTAAPTGNRDSGAANQSRVSGNTRLSD